MMRAVLCALLAVPLAAQTVIKSSGASGSGGATTLDGLTDVTITSAADGDGLRHNGTAFVNTALFTAGTSDILAARMAANWGTAGTSACSTSGGVLYDNGTAIVCDANFKYNGTALNVKSGTGGGIAFGTSLYIQSNTSGNVALYSTGPGQLGHSFRLDNVEFFRIGGSQTALLQDQTATTGITSVIVKGGAGQSTTDLMQWQDNAGAVLGRITSDGYGKLPAVQLVDPGAKPSCTSDTRGMIWYDAGGAGVADTAEICGKDASDVYAWVAIATF